MTATGTIPAAPSAHPFAPAPYLVTRRSVETGDTSTLELTPIGGGPIPPFRPGQFNMLYAFGLGEVAISISGPPAGNERLVHTVRSVGPTSTAIQAALPGTTVGVRGPYGVGWPMEAAAGRDVLLLAGGLGLAPLRPAIYALFADRARFGRIEVMYGARTPKDLLYLDEIAAWRSRPDARFQVTVDTAGRDWYGDVGVVTARLPDARFDAANAVAFVCGPELMMRLSAQALETRGIPADRIYVSLERNMKCAIAQCGHCQLGPAFVCRDGPVLPFSTMKRYLLLREA